jgi:hypothetical protein
MPNPPIKIDTDPLERLLRRAAAATVDPGVRTWLGKLARSGERASGTAPPGRPAAAPTTTQT